VDPTLVLSVERTPKDSVILPKMRDVQESDACVERHAIETRSWIQSIPPLWVYTFGIIHTFILLAKRYKIQLDQEPLYATVGDGEPGDAGKIGEVENKKIGRFR